jgi:enoyl-CoA hydratase
VRNAVDPTTASALQEAFQRFDADASLAVAVLTGAGGTFCGGFDLRAVAASTGYLPDEERPGPMGPTRMTLSKPVIAAIEGYAVAGGLELALWCDVRVAARDATLGVFNRRFGVPLRRRFGSDWWNGWSSQARLWPRPRASPARSPCFLQKPCEATGGAQSTSGR